MEVDVVIDMARASLSAFLNDTCIHYDMEAAFFKDPKPDGGWLALWLLESLIDDHRYAGNRELSLYRHSFKRDVEMKNERRKRDNREDKPVWSDEHIDKILWSFDIFLMEMASNYIEN